MQRTEPVRPVPSPHGPAQKGDIDTGSEPGELAGPVGERAEPETGREIEGATAQPSVTVPCVEDDVTVQQARGNTRVLVVIDVRAGRDLCEVGHCDRAMPAGLASVRCAILLYLEMPVSLVGGRYWSSRAQ